MCGGIVDLLKQADGQLHVANQPVLVQRVIGSRIVLVIPGGQVAVTIGDYWWVMCSDDADEAG